jgi:hypothetical protein
MEITIRNNNFEKDSKRNDIFRIEAGGVEWGSSEEAICGGALSTTAKQFQMGCRAILLAF